jgi:TatA/E family protein of Tat protein translocase
MVIVVLLFGADKLPKLARGLGKSLGEFKKAKEEFDKEVQSATTETEAKKLDDKAATTATTGVVSPSEPAKKI